MTWHPSPSGPTAHEPLWLPGTIIVSDDDDGASQSAAPDSDDGASSPSAPRARLADGRVVRVAMTVRSLFDLGGAGDGGAAAAGPGAATTTTHEAVRVRASDTAAPGGADPTALAAEAASFRGGGGADDRAGGGAAEYRGWNDIEALGRRAKALSRALESTDDGIGKALLDSGAEMTFEHDEDKKNYYFERLRTVGKLIGVAAEDYVKRLEKDVDEKFFPDHLAAASTSDAGAAADASHQRAAERAKQKAEVSGHDVSHKERRLSQ